MFKKKKKDFILSEKNACQKLVAMVTSSRCILRNQIHPGQISEGVLKFHGVCSNVKKGIQDQGRRGQNPLSPVSIARVKYYNGTLCEIIL